MSAMLSSALKIVDLIAMGGIMGHGAVFAKLEHDLCEFGTYGMPLEGLKFPLVGHPAVRRAGDKNLMYLR